MVTASTLAALLALDPTAIDPASDFADQLNLVVATGDEREFQIIGYDAAGEPIGFISLWVDDADRVHISSDYGDGYEETVIVGDQHRTSSSLPAGSAAERAELMAGLVVAEASWVGCAVRVAAAVTLCSPPFGATAIITCPGTAYLAICECGEAAGLTPNPGMCP